MSNETISIEEIESTESGFVELEMALNEAKSKLGWKDFTCFLVNYCLKKQPQKNNYNLNFWLKLSRAFN